MRVVGCERVSTARQGGSGLGIEAQPLAIDGFVAQRGATLITRITKAESGRNPDWPELKQAASAAGEHAAGVEFFRNHPQARCVGLIVAMATQIVAFPLLGLQASLGQNARLALVFTVVSIGRSFLLRRLFEGLRG